MLTSHHIRFFFVLALALVFKVRQTEYSNMPFEMQNAGKKDVSNFI